MKTLIIFFALVVITACDNKPLLLQSPNEMIERAKAEELERLEKAATVYNVAWADGFLRGRQNIVGNWRDARSVDSMRFITAYSQLPR